MVGRIPVMDVTPLVEHGRYPAKASVGEVFPVTALVFREGHDELGCEVVLTDPGGVRRTPVRMAKIPDRVDRYTAEVAADAEGAWTFEIQAWSDPLATWLHHTEVKVPAGVDVELMFTEGGLLLDRMGADPGLTAQEKGFVADTSKGMRDTSRPVEARLRIATSAELRALAYAHPLRDLVSVEGPYPLFVDRRRALFGSWYEFFAAGYAGACGPHVAP